MTKPATPASSAKPTTVAMSKGVHVSGDRSMVSRLRSRIWTSSIGKVGATEKSVERSMPEFLLLPERLGDGRKPCDYIRLATSDPAVQLERLGRLDFEPRE